MRNYELKDLVALRGVSPPVFLGEVVAFLPYPPKPEWKLVLVELTAGSRLPAQAHTPLCDITYQVNLRYGAWLEGDLVKWNG